MKPTRRRLDLQAKITLVLVAVILPTFLIVTVAQNKLTKPILEEEMRQVGITSAKTLASEIVSSRWLSLPDPTTRIENHIQETLYSQPNILRMDVVVKDPVTGVVKNIASNIEEEPGASPSPLPLVEALTTEFKEDENGMGTWEISVPIEQRSRDSQGPKKLLGSVHVVTSLKLVNRFAGTLWRTTVMAAAFSVVALLLVLSYFLRKTITNDRLLRQAETQNLQLTAQLHDAQRQLMNTEKLAVMGQLTASFAHEIGTPLNAIGGHLQLLKEEVSSPDNRATEGRFDIINGQLAKIEEIVKSFLQSTAKPASQKQLVDVNQLIEKTLGILRPRIESEGVEIKRKLDRTMGPIRAVPLDVEQVLLNLLNNSLDSLKARHETVLHGMHREKGKTVVEVTSDTVQQQGKTWAEVSVYDTGEGIKKADLANVLKPFYTTKRPGEGTGLGLTICQQLVSKYGGALEIDSREGSWTRVTFRIPYGQA